MKSFNNKNFYNNEIIIFLIFYSTILIGFYFNEDSLGGARHDFSFHFEISKNFNENFFLTFLNFTNIENFLPTRNSPVFWSIFSILNKIFNLDILRLINSLVSILIAIYFFKCLELKFKHQKKIVLILLSSAIFLSPTIRSLSIWPYSLIWGLLFFILSIYNFLKFKEGENLKIKFNLSVKFLTFLILSSYIHPSFGIFIIFFSIYLYEEFKITKFSIYLILYCFVLSIPFLYYIYSINLLNSFRYSQGLEVSFLESFNISNKIVIISTMFIYFIFPILNIKQTIFEIKNDNIKSLLIVFIFCFLNIYFFDFPYFEKGGFGGGFFHKLSNIMFNNNFLLYFIFILSLIIIRKISINNKYNYILLIILVMSNPQFTIYNKYFDPLIFILFFTLFEFDTKKHFFEKKFKFVQLYLVLLAYLTMSMVKSYLFAI